MAFNNVCRLNGVDVATPKVFNFTKNDIDGETTRDASGTLHRDRLAIKRKLSCEWGYITADAAKTILKAIEPQTISVYYYDPLDAAYVTKTFYAGDITLETYTQKSGTPIYKSLKFDLIMC